ncbi:hypothetical protein OG259_33950 [Streptomyces sp. NBC_00250]|uniref:hypothetical protein n=1 Tax=Streptomyces sp. NBC_00250 TaxID=2903641 RepID=UPI002E2CC932|nr:hypothetical protein [Streptomyces sp. NBC_00250]
MVDVDIALHNKVREVGNLVARLSEQVGSVSGQVHSVEARQQQTTDELQQLRADFQAFMQQSQLIANVQRAETRIGVLQDELDHEFGHHKVVRRTAVGTLQAFDVGIVSEDSFHAVSDQLMLQTPRYWLAPALVALATWSSDDRELCERAVEEAFRRSPDRTSLFFALVLRRQNRRQSAARWLRHYLLAQDPNRLGREFAVILESIAQGAFGPEGRAMLDRTLREWREVLMADTDTRARQVQRWRDEIESLRAPSAKAEFPRLSVVSPQWPELDAVLSAARTHQHLLDKYQAILEREPELSGRLEDTVDDILDRLVSEYDNDELPLRRDLAFNKKIVEHDGDLDSARKESDADSASYEETLDYLTVQSAAALNPAAIGTSGATQRMAVAACHEWFFQAHTGFTRDARGAVPQDVRAVFGTAHTVGAQTFQLPPWQGSFAQPLADNEASLARHWDQHMRPFIDALAFPMVKKLVPPVLVVLGILLVIGQIDLGFAFVAALITGGIWGLALDKQAKAAQNHQDNAGRLLGQARLDSLHQLRGAAAELTDWYEKFRAADAVEARCRELITSLATANHGASPFEGRTVLKEDHR